MRFVMFYHSLVSDWNHGNAHFLRGVTTELLALGHEVAIYEPRSAWSRLNLEAEHGTEAVRAFATAYPQLSSTRYDLDTIDLPRVLDGADVVLVHEWNDHDLVRRIGLERARRRFALLFHDTHHRAVTEPESMRAYDLRNYDGVLAFGAVLRDLYLERSWAAQAWTWHEAADTRRFRPIDAAKDGDLVWVGNWGDDERTRELTEFLIEPVRALGLSAAVHGVRYPREALETLSSAGIESRGWLPNFMVPDVFARHRVTVHVPRGPYVDALPGIPTIRVFEALACGIPLISAPWNDVEGLFRPGEDFLFVKDRREMTDAMRAVLHEPALRNKLIASGFERIYTRHSCAHRAAQLLDIVGGITGAGQTRKKLERATA